MKYMKQYFNKNVLFYAFSVRISFYIFFLILYIQIYEIYEYEIYEIYEIILQRKSYISYMKRAKNI